MKEALDSTESVGGQDVTFVVPDGRTIAARIIGPDYGVPVLALHGNPGSRIGPHLAQAGLEELGVRLIAPDRPGYGLSDRHEGRKISDTAADMAALMDYLDVKEFGVLARSGGVPHALGCAALLGDRVFGVFSFAGLAPKTAPIDWTEGMTDDNKTKHATAVASPEKLMDTMRQHAESIRQNEYHLLQMLQPDLQPDDTWGILCAHYGQCTGPALAASQEEGLRQDGVGWVDDTLALHNDWGFAVQSITSPVMLWHGAQDPFASPKHSQWLHKEIPNATYVEDPEGSHMSSLKYGYNALRELRDLWLGPDRQELLYTRLTEIRQSIFEEWDVNEAIESSIDANGEILFTDNNIRRRLAEDEYLGIMPYVTQAVILGLDATVSSRLRATDANS